MRRRPLSRSFVVWIGLAISLGFSYLAVRDVDFDVFWSALSESEYWWVGPSLAALALTVFVRVLRWRLLFVRASRPPVGATARAVLIGYLFNNILPARAGEAARVVALHQTTGTSRAEAVGTAVTERVYDVVALLLVLFVSLPFLPEVTWLRAAGVLSIVVLVLLAATAAVLVRWGDRPVRFALRPLAYFPRISPERTDLAAGNLVQGLAGFVRPTVAVTALALTVVSWLVLAVSYWFLMAGFDLDLGFRAAVLAVVATNLVLVIPSSPAAVGVFEAATQVALGAFGVGDSHALSYAVVLHAVNFLPFVVIGYVVLHRHSVALRERGASAPRYDTA